MNTPDQTQQDLHDTLEQRYGPFVARDIIEQIQKADSMSTPDYMAVKAASETLEFVRIRMRNTFRRLKSYVMKKSTGRQESRISRKSGWSRICPGGCPKISAVRFCITYGSSGVIYAIPAMIICHEIGF